MTKIDLDQKTVGADFMIKIGAMTAVALTVVLVIWQLSGGFYVTNISIMDWFKIDFKEMPSPPKDEHPAVTPQRSSSGPEPLPAPTASQPSSTVRQSSGSPSIVPAVDMTGAWAAETSFSSISIRAIMMIKPDTSYTTVWQYPNGDFSQARGNYTVSWSDPGTAVMSLNPTSCESTYCPPKLLSSHQNKISVIDKNTIWINMGDRGTTAKRIRWSNF